MKNTRMALFVLVILGTAVGAFWYLTHDKQGRSTYATEKRSVEQTSTLEQDYIEVPSVTYLTTSDSVPRLRYTYSLTYPVITLTSHPKETNGANSVIKTFALDRLDTFRKNLESDGELSEGGQTSDLTMQSRAMLLSPTILSLRFDSAEYIAGGAHPNNQTHILNYDIEKETIITTEELFASTTQALPFLSEYSRKVLKARFSDVSEEEFRSTVIPGTAPTRENFRAVAISKNGISVIFDPYQVAPYARGTAVVLIPVSDALPMLSPRISAALRLSESNIQEATEDIPQIPME